MSAELQAEQTKSLSERRAVQPHPAFWARLFVNSPFVGISVVSIAVVFIGWEAAVAVFNIKIIVLPAPSLIMTSLVDYAQEGELLSDVVATGRRALIGLFLGMTIGVGLGVLIGWFPKMRAALNPWVAITFPIPKIALVPLFIIWFGLGDPFKIVLIVTGVFYVSLINTVAGVEAIPTVTIMACRNLGASSWHIFQKVVLPSSVPVTFAALRISYSGALILVVAAEMITSTDGLGFTIARAGELLIIERVFAVLIVSGVLGVTGYWLIDRAEVWLTPWKVRGSNAIGM